MDEYPQMQTSGRCCCDVKRDARSAENVQGQDLEDANGDTDDAGGEI